jgi:hypothetical protein
MTTSDAAQLERRKLSEIIRNYRRRGYEVRLAPEPDDLPAALRPFKIAAIARNDGESVAIDVKTSQSLKASTELPRLAQAVQGVPGWRLELVVTNPVHRRIAAPGEALDPSDIQMRFGEAKELAHDGSDTAAMLLAWSAVEGALRLMAQREGIAIERDAPDYILRKLVVLGLLGHADYRVLRSAAEVRDALVHGFTSPALDRQLVSQVASLGEKLLHSPAA